jgi:transposase-like protein
MYLYRSVDSEGNTLEFLLSPTLDAEATKRFFVKTLHSTACSAPQAHLLEALGGRSTAAATHNTTSHRMLLAVQYGYLLHNPLASTRLAQRCTPPGSPIFVMAL